jgi:hypothetical protein
MIKVTKDYNNPPVILNVGSCENKVLKSVMNESSKDGSNKNIYNGHHYRHSQVTTALNLLYNEKCAYCESNSDHVSTLRVEHYRPKAEVHEFVVDNNGNEKREEIKEHKGYYWLGCEWSNLLLACEKCNGQSAKGNLFPISGTRVNWTIPFTDEGIFDRTELIASNDPLIKEFPLLLNPEIDNPIFHINLTSHGFLIPNNDSLKGKESIKVYDLNRYSLYKKRRTIIDNLLKEIKVLIERLADRIIDIKAFKLFLEDIFRKIATRRQATQEYSFLGFCMYNQFDTFFLPFLEPMYRSPINQQFLRYKQRNP